METWQMQYIFGNDIKEDIIYFYKPYLKNI